MKNSLWFALAALMVCACGTEGGEPPVDPGAFCGPGTHLEGSRCFPDTPGLTCGSGTVEQAGVCVATLSCGPGTSQQGTQCIPLSTITCGAGTHLEDNHCVPNESELTCGAGTHREGNQCFSDTPEVTCGSGTVEQAGECVAELSCGPGTIQQGTQCVPSSTITCGAGTRLEGSTCVANCGTGTHLGDNQCIANGWYEVRIGASVVPADGYSKVPVMALGRLPDGRPATDAVVLSLNRSTAGTLQTPALNLAPLGANTFLVPCSASTSNPLCAGPARISMVLASQPNVTVAESAEFTLVAPTGVGSTAPCDPYPRALFFDGSGYIFTGTQTVTDGTWSASASPSSGPTYAAVHVTPTSSSQGLWWDANFAAPSGAGPFQEQVYPTAERYPFQPPGVAGLSVTGDGRGCNQSSGRFQIHRLTMSGGVLTEFLATFEQFCEKSPNNVLRGCVKYTR